MRKCSGAGGSKFCFVQHTCSSLPYMNTVTSRSDLREPRGRKNHCKLAHWRVGLIVCCTFQLCVKWGSTNTGWHINVFFFTYKIGMGHSWLIWVGYLQLIRWGICGLLGVAVYGKVSYCSRHRIVSYPDWKRQSLFTWMAFLNYYQNQ